MLGDRVHRLIRLIRPLGVAHNPPPRLEGTFCLSDGRRLGFAEYGDPRGPLVLWFHGSPGARRQVPPAARRAADELGLRIVCVERPGVGYSTDHAYGQIADWTADVEQLADRLGRERFMVMGLSGGGPYALACAHDLPDRVVAVGLLGSLVPVAGEEATAAGIVAYSRRLNGWLRLFRRPFGIGILAFIKVATPFAHGAVIGFAKLMPPGDQRVLHQKDLEAMFVDDIVTGAERQFKAFVNDFYLLGRPWGFRMSDVEVPVRWWHGDSDPFVPLDQARRASLMLHDVELNVRPGESHLGDFAAADEALTELAKVWHQRGASAIA